jgi:hypothetical protein
VIPSLQREASLAVRGDLGDGTRVLKECNYSFYLMGTIVLGLLFGWKAPSRVLDLSIYGTISWRYLNRREFLVWAGSLGHRNARGICHSDRGEREGKASPKTPGGVRVWFDVHGCCRSKGNFYLPCRRRGRICVSLAGIIAPDDCMCNRPGCLFRGKVP